MVDELANAGPAASAQATAPINGTADTTTETPAAGGGFRAAFEKATAQLNGTSSPATKTDGIPAAQQSASSAGGDTAELADALKAPERWEPGWKDAFAKQPKEVQQAWLDQHRAWETGYGRKFQELSGAQKFHSAVAEAITPDVRADMASAGLDEAGATKYLFKQFSALKSDPINTIAGFMRQYGVDPRVYLQGQDMDGQATPSAAQIFAPIVQPLLSKIQELEQKYQGWDGELQAQSAKASEATFDAFYAEKDASGAARYPHVDRVAERMAELLESDPRLARMDLRQGLEEAYLIAVLSDASLRDEMVRAEADKRLKAIERDAHTGRFRSAASAKPAAGTSAPAPQAKGLRGAFAQAQSQLASR